MKKVEKDTTKKRLLVNVPEWLIAEYDKMAEETGVLRSNLISIAIKEYYDQKVALKSMVNMKDFVSNKFESAFMQALESDDVVSDDTKKE